MALGVDSVTTAAALRSSNQRSIAWHGSWSLILNGVALSANLCTGILVARLLGPAGRGQLASITLPPQLVGWVLAVGCAQAVSFHQARKPHDAGRLLSTWLLILAPLSLLAVAIGEIALPFLLKAQSAETLHLAELYMTTAVIVLLGDLVNGMLLGDQQFLLFNGLRLAQPLLTVLGYALLWKASEFSLVPVLIASAAAALTTTLFATVWVVRRHGLGQPTFSLARDGVWYGLKAHGTNVGDLINTRLDLTIIPAFLAASSVGVYAVSSTVSGLVFVGANSVTLLILPIAVQRGSQGLQSAVRLTRATFWIALIGAGLIAALSPIAVRVAYGPSFDASLGLLWLLLPGTVLYATAAALRSALNAANKPFLATICYGTGMAVTVVGLIVLLHPFGLMAAAIVSSVSYGVVFGLSLLTYCRVTQVKVSAFFDVRDDAALVVAAWRRASTKYQTGQRRG